MKNPQIRKISPKNHTLLDQFYMNLILYSRYARTVLNCEKRPFLREFLDEPDTPLTFEWPPGLFIADNILKAAIVTVSS